MDKGHIHPHQASAWIHPKGGIIDAWWDTEYGPDGNMRTTGPFDDERRRVLVLSSGLTRAQYVEWDPAVVAPFICEAAQVQPLDVWVDLDPPPYRYDGNTLILCKQDTLPSERDELHARGFIYLGSRGDVMYFVNPFGPIDISTHTDTYYEGPRVRIVIHRSGCMCSTYHKEPGPHGAWYWSRVGFDGIPPRDPPIQPPETADAAHEREERRQMAAQYMQGLRAKADGGNRGAAFMMSLFEIQKSVREAAEEEALKLK